MKSNKLKGVTLIETMLYIGLFSIILIIVLNFMLSTQESTQRTNDRANVYKSSELITQHINYSFNKTNSVNDINCIFGVNQGVLELTFAEGSKQYYLQNNTLYFDSIPITPSSISVTKFFLEPIYKDLSIIGIKTNIELVLNSNSSITDTINLLSIIR